MKKTIFAAACALALSTVMASAQSSQGDAGPGTMNNKSMVNPPDRSNPAMNNSGTVGSGMNAPMRSGGAMNNNGIAANPSSQGNAGPGTNPNLPAGR